MLCATLPVNRHPRAMKKYGIIGFAIASLDAVAIK
jgi:hypothetical protein